MGKKYLLVIICLLLLTGCKPKTYTVTFMDSNTQLAKIVVKKGENISEISKPTKEGYLFLNWLKDGIDYNEDNPITEDITLEATWTPVPTIKESHMVTFNFGDEVKTTTVKDGDTVSEPKQIPKKEKYKFIGWFIGDTKYDFNTPVDKDLNIEARFEKSRIIINYDLDGGSGTIQVEIDKGSIPPKPKIPTKFGYTFTNFTINGIEYNYDTPLYEDTTIKANYEANVYFKVTFDSNGGSEVPSQMIQAGYSIETIPKATKPGYIFKYWTFDGEKYDINMVINSNITLVAYYEKEN